MSETCDNGPSSFDRAVLTTRVAQPADIDELGHVNNAAYVHWIQDAAVSHWTDIARGPLYDRYYWVCLRHEIDYREPILPGETAEVRTWLGRRSGPRFDRLTDIRKPGSVRGSVKALTTWVLLDKVTSRPQRVSDAILTAFGLDPASYD
jgi:acyl-CoA thioester hydrolase